MISRPPSNDLLLQMISSKPSTFLRVPIEVIEWILPFAFDPSKSSIFLPSDPNQRSSDPTTHRRPFLSSSIRPIIPPNAPTTQLSTSSGTSTALHSSSGGTSPTKSPPSSAFLPRPRSHPLVENWSRIVDQLKSTPKWIPFQFLGFERGFWEQACLSVECPWGEEWTWRNEEGDVELSKDAFVHEERPRPAEGDNGDPESTSSSDWPR
ncbi:hypothetical protein BDY24DRAFT_389145 [Mrakia frigida]|uniref:uncharacterized protein n=1 Tax=Mrakia frigida TaxID=29902 RepID=UPI003FCC0A5A